MKKIEQEIADFKSEMIMRMPFYGELLSHIDIVENRRISTAGTNGRVIYYNRHFLEGMEPGQRNYILMHELFHIILIHFKRQTGKNEKIWNVAADYVVNGLLDNLINKQSFNYRDYGVDFKRPSCGCFLDQYNNQSVEELYKTISDDNANNSMKNIWIFVYPSYNLLKEDTVNVLRIKSGDMDLLTNMTEEEASEIEEEINNLIENALKNWAHDPSKGLVQRALAVLKHGKRLPWKTLLKRYLSDSDADDTSYDHPERKYLHMDMILPGVSEESIKNSLDNVWAFIDTSGSIGADELNDFVTQLYNICKQFDVTMNIGYWDDEMHEVYKCVSANRITECITSYSGGTRAEAIYDYLDEHKIIPKVMIILTDGDFYPVSNERTKKYRDKTIVVLSYETSEDISNMGKLTRL